MDSTSSSFQVILKYFSMPGMFAIAESKQVKWFMTHFQCTEEEGTDALEQQQSKCLLYIFPPTILILQTLTPIRFQKAELILMTLHWPRKTVIFGANISAIEATLAALKVGGSVAW